MKFNKLNLKESLPSLFSEESKRVLVIALVIMIITTIPYTLGFAKEGEVWRFTGFVFGVEDGNSYVAKMLRGTEGDWLFRTPYTAKQQNGVLVYFPYLLLGKLAGFPGKHVQLVVLYHVYRFGAGVIAILATYDLISLFVKGKRLRLTGWLIACFGGGLGYLLVISGKDLWLGTLPLEFYSPESFGFLTLLGLPHLAMARGLFFWGLIFYLRADIKTGGLITGFLWLIMGFFQPLTVVLGWAIIGGHLIYLVGVQMKNLLTGREEGWSVIEKWFLRAILTGIIPFPMIIYTIIALRVDPVVSEWTAQNLVHSPHPFHYLMAYGLVIPFAVIGAVLQSKSGKAETWLLPAWLILFPFLVYAPFDMQRRLAEGFWVVLIILFLIVLEHASKPLRRIGQVLLVLTLPSTIFLYSGALLTASNPSIPLYRPNNEVEAFKYLDENAEASSVVLCAYETGNALPAWAPVYVVIGHGPESAGIDELLPKVEEFYQEDSGDSYREGLLEDLKVDYVFWGPAERELGGWDPGTAEYLEVIFKKNDFELYQVKVDGD